MANNGTSECYRCAIFAGNTENPIRYVASLKIDDAERVAYLSPEDPTKSIGSLKEPGVVDEADISHNVKFIQPAITHQHSGSEYVHWHYIFNRLGDNCIFCGAPVIGISMCVRPVSTALKHRVIVYPLVMTELLPTTLITSDSSWFKILNNSNDRIVNKT